MGIEPTSEAWKACDLTQESAGIGGMFAIFGTTELENNGKWKLGSGWACDSLFQRNPSHRLRLALAISDVGRVHGVKRQKMKKQTGTIVSGGLQATVRRLAGDRLGSPSRCGFLGKSLAHLLDEIIRSVEVRLAESPQDSFKIEQPTQVSFRQDAQGSRYG
jgi:hypothetical protein